MAVMNEILALIQLFRGFREQYLLTIYGSTLNGSSEFVQTGLSRPLFAMCLVLAAMMFGYFLAILFYRSGKAGRLCIAAGLPVFTFVVLPPLVVFYRNTPFMQGLWKFFRLILGLDNGNPFYLIGTCVVVFLLFSVFSFLLMRKVPLRR